MRWAVDAGAVSRVRNPARSAGDTHLAQDRLEGRRRREDDELVGCQRPDLELTVRDGIRPR